MKTTRILAKLRRRPTDTQLSSGYSFLFGPTSAGRAVNERTAMQMTAVYSCVRILAEAIAGLPLHVYRTRSDGGKENAVTLPLRFWCLRGGRLIVLQFRGPCFDTGFRVDKEESFYPGYFAEFGHNGLYLSFSLRLQDRLSLWYGGLIIPAEHARDLSARFRFIKEQGLKEEIDALVRSKGMSIEQWAALLATKNIETYAQTRRIMFRILSTLDKLGARSVICRQQKPCGEPDFGARSLSHVIRSHPKVCVQCDQGPRKRYVGFMRIA